jgi:hypothetical protein
MWDSRIGRDRGQQVLTAQGCRRHSAECQRLADICSAMSRASWARLSQCSAPFQRLGARQRSGLNGKGLGELIGEVAEATFAQNIGEGGEESSQGWAVRRGRPTWSRRCSGKRKHPRPALRPDIAIGAVPIAYSSSGSLTTAGSLFWSSSSFVVFIVVGIARGQCVAHDGGGDVGHAAFFERESARAAPRLHLHARVWRPWTVLNVLPAAWHGRSPFWERPSLALPDPWEPRCGCAN